MTEGDPKRDSATHVAAFGVVDAERGRLQERARLLSEVLGAFAEATTDYEQLLDVISHKLAEVVGDLCSVVLASEDGQSLAMVASHDLDPEVRALARATFAGKPLTLIPVQHKVLETGEPYLQQRINRETLASTTTEARARFAEAIGMHSVLLVALRTRGRPIGMLNLVRHRADQPPYDEHDRDLAQLLADHAAVAITNARLLRRRENDLVHARDTAERATQELEAFSYSVAHDLRAPLRVIDHFTHALHADHAARLDDDGRHLLDRVGSASQRMAHLIDDLLTLSRVSHTTLHRGRVDLSELARRIMAELVARTPDRAVELRIPDGLVVTADPGLMELVLENLLENAWKFTSHQATAVIEVGCERHGHDAMWFVRDNGAGFDMKYADRLFRPFQRLHSDAEFEGSGVGLATVQRIIRRHGGTVRPWSQPGGGTTMFFTLGDDA